MDAINLFDDAPTDYEKFNYAKKNAEIEKAKLPKQKPKKEKKEGMEYYEEKLTFNVKVKNDHDW